MSGRRRGVLTDKQQRFVVEYCVDWNGTQAAIRAGWSEKSAATEAWRLLRKVEIRAAIDARTVALADHAEISGARVLLELKRLAFADARTMFDAEGRLHLPRQLDDAIAAAVKKIEVVTRTIDGGDDVEYVHKLELHDKLPALDRLGKRLRLWSDKVELATAGDQPLPVRIVHHQLSALPDKDMAPGHE